ncbi:MAG: transporter substrate-binding domain-containing protein, partial [Algicola sp.]|nr:transporter substrate-binding domain-containing protein [Algicola sp.]
MRSTLVVMLFLLLSDTAFAQSTILITTEHWPPNNYLSKQGKIIGKATEKVRKIFEKAGLHFTIKLYPWARAYHLAMNEPNTAVYSIVRSTQREALFQWVCPLIKQQPLYFVHLTKRKDIVLDQLTDAKKYLIATTRNEFDHQFLLQNGFVEGQHFELTADDQTNIKMLLIGRTDLFISSEQTIARNISQHGGKLADVRLAMP